MTREQNQLIRKLRALSPDDIVRVQQFMQQLRSPEPVTVPDEPAGQAVSPEAEVASAACAQWLRRPFQAIDADDLQPIAALFREAKDIRAASRVRYGSR